MADVIDGLLLPLTGCPLVSSLLPGSKSVRIKVDRRVRALPLLLLSLLLKLPFGVEP